MREKIGGCIINDHLAGELGGALARVMKLKAGGRGAFTFEGLDRSELLTAFK